MNKNKITLKGTNASILDFIRDSVNHTIMHGMIHDEDDIEFDVSITLDNEGDSLVISSNLYFQTLMSRTHGIYFNIDNIKIPSIKLKEDKACVIQANDNDMCMLNMVGDIYNIDTIDMILNIDVLTIGVLDDAFIKEFNDVYTKYYGINISIKEDNKAPTNNKTKGKFDDYDAKELARAYSTGM